jgi:hypothetical protein
MTRLRRRALLLCLYLNQQSVRASRAHTGHQTQSIHSHHNIFTLVYSQTHTFTFITHRKSVRELHHTFVPHIHTHTRILIFTITYTPRRSPHIFTLHNTHSHHLTLTTTLTFTYTPRRSVRQPCWQFNEKGDCEYGEDCRFSHGDNDTRPPKKVGPCYGWRESGTCSYGDRCRFEHDDVSPPSAD